MITPAQSAKSVQTQNEQPHYSYKTPLILMCFLVLSLLVLSVVLISQNSKTITPTPHATNNPPTPSYPTANWKTFTNAELGFSIKYPNTYKEKGPQPLIDSNMYFLQDNRTIFYISSVLNTRLYPLASYKRDRAWYKPEDQKNAKVVYIDNIKALTFGYVPEDTDYPKNSEVTIIEQPDKILEFWFEDNQNSSSRSIFAQILSSFKFINSEQNAITSAHVLISGHVQGVGFRNFVQTNAQRLSVTGWVKNLPDGTVEAVFEGKKEVVEQLIALCKTGPPSASVTDVKVDWNQTLQNFTNFQILQ